MTGSPERREFDRRGFLQLVAAALASLPATAAAQAPTPPAAAAPPAPPAAPAPPAHSGSESRLLAEVLRSRYPDRFAEAQWASVVTDFDGDLGAGKRLRAVKLKNADEPDFTFRP
jgi:hypothetical protein